VLVVAAVVVVVVVVESAAAARDTNRASAWIEARRLCTLSVERLSEPSSEDMEACCSAEGKMRSVWRGGRVLPLPVAVAVADEGPAGSSDTMSKEVSLPGLTEGFGVVV